MPFTDDEQDRRLARRARLGDERAFAELVDRHRGPLVRWVARRSGRPELAEDAVQEGLMAAHRALRSGTAGSPADVRAWLHTIAWRRAVDLVRRERPALALDEAADAASAPGPEAAVLRAIELDRVVAAWSALPARQREALRMSALEGRSLEEIAAALGGNAGAAKSLVARGRRALAARLALDELRCEDVRAELLSATERGVRLTADAGRHVKDCRDCSRLHRRARRKRRVQAAAFSPPALLATKLRDYVFALVGHEPQVSLATKVCAGACATALAGSIAAAPVATSTLALSSAPVVILATERPASVKVHHAPRATEKRHRKKARRAVATATAATSTATTATATTSTPITTTTTTSRPATEKPQAARATLVGEAEAPAAAYAPAHRPGDIARAGDADAARPAALLVTPAG